jgi:hypothetical protein
MTRVEIIAALRNAKIQDLLETDIDRDNDPLVISGFTTENGYTVYLKSIPGSESVEISVGRPAEEAELRSFKERLAKSEPNSFFDFNPRYIDLATIRRLVEEHAKVIKASDGGANEAFHGQVRIRFGEKL